MINYRLLIVSICIVLGLVLYLFFWNRFLGSIIARIIRLLFWNQGESSVWVDIGSIHISIIGGRILLKDLAYHSSNQTIRVVKGQVSWRYWIRAPADEDDLSHARVVGEDIGRKSDKSPLSCRVHVSFQGLEWFIYNKTAAYDNIVSAMESLAGDTNTAPDGRASLEGISSLRKIFSWTSAAPDATHFGPPISLVSSIYSRTPDVVKGWLTRLRNQLPSMDPKDLLPISLEIVKGAFIVGNDSTPTLLVAEYRRSEGTYGIVPSRSKHDYYKQVVNLKFRDVNIRFVNNTRDVSGMIETGERLQRDIRAANHRPLRSFSYLTFNTFAKLWRRHKLWTGVQRRSRGSTFIHGGQAASWSRRRAHKAMDEETPLGADFAALEYAKEPKIVEAPILELLYYADSVGQVPNHVAVHSDDPLDIGNGDLPPEWGVDIAICGGFIRYGPWADRQRTILQQTFFPSAFVDSSPFVRLKPGDARFWPSLNILVELRDGVSLQIPFREASKNWQWDGEVPIPNRPRKREAASIHVRAGDNSTISYMMPMVATPRGYEPTLNVHLDTVSVTSSLNDIRLLRAESCVVRCELPSPLRWNEQRQWTFALSLRNPLIYLLRDHINMLTDLGKDWASGPPSDYDRFIPMIYNVAVEMKNYDLKLYVNDHNIIDKPSIPDENAFLSFNGASLQHSITIPSAKYRPESSTVSFSVEGSEIEVSLSLPKWNTRSLYVKPHRTNDVGRIGHLRLDASYCYFSEVHSENIDQLKLMLVTKDVVYKACGWTIRHFMTLRNNYFGSFTHFSTLFEYLEKRRLGQPLGDPVDLQYREGSSNPLQVQLGATVEKGLMVIPAGLRGYEIDRHYSGEGNDIGTCTMMAIPELQVHLRTHDYYMEMSLDIDHISTTTHLQCSEDLRCTWAEQRNAKEMLIIDGVSVVAHRLFGPLPRTTTYFCIWEFHVGRIMGRMSALETRTFMASSRQFGFTFSDPLNAPAAEFDIPTDPDVTFLKLTVDEVNLVWQAESAVAELSLPQGLRLDSNDVAGQAYSKVTSMRVPQASLKILICKTVDLNEWHEASSFELDLNVDLYSAPANWPEKAKAQIEFLAAQDSHTGRVMFLYMPDQSFPHDSITTGRGLLDTAFYLPQIRIPKNPGHYSQDSANDIAKESQRVPSAYAASPLAIPRHLVNHSESDGDEYISEADRDARIAKLRPQSRSVWRNDNEDISSGDESDTDDLTDAEQSDSETENKKKKGPVPSVFPMLLQYGRYTRIYTSHWLHQPSWWHKSPFSLRQDNSFSRQRSLIQRRVEELPDALSGKDLDDFASSPSDGTVSTTIIRISSRSGLSITLMPLVVPAVDILLSDMRNHNLSPELRFDGIIVDHVQSLYQDDEGDVPRNTILDARLARVHLRMMQLLTTNLNRSKANGHHVDQDHSSSFVELYSEDMRISIAQGTLQPTSGECLPRVKASFERLGLGSLSPDQADSTFDITSTASQFSLREQEAAVTLGDVIVNVSHAAPAQLLPTGLSMLEFAQGLSKPFGAMERHRPVLYQNVIYRAVQIAQDKTILDPLSTIQPSYLIQSGRPHKLRTDVGFKYLAYLRDYLQHLEASDRALLFDPPEDFYTETNLDEVTHLLQNQLKMFNTDLELQPIPSQSPLATLFKTSPNCASAMSQKSFQSLNAVTFKLSRLKTVCRSPTDVSSEFVLRTVIISVHMRTTESLQPHVLSPTKSTTTLSIRDKSRLEMRHIGAIISVGDVALSIYPSLMRLAQAIVHTLKGHNMEPFGLQRSSSRSPTRSISPEISPATYVDLVLTTRSVKFVAGAEKLLVEYKATSVDFASTMLISPSRSRRQPWDLSMNHSLTMDEIRIQACAVADLAKPNEHGVLAAFIVGGGHINLILKRESDSPPVVRLVLGLSYVHLNVPRSAIRLVRFMEEWTADYLPGLNATIQDLLSELHESPPKAEMSRGAEPRASLCYQVDAAIPSLRVSLQVMRGTWVSWEIAHILAYASYSEIMTSKAVHNFGLQIGSQAVIISSKEHSMDAVPNVRMKIPLPNFTVNGRGDRSRIEGLALIETFTANIKPSHWDTLLTVQQKFGQDFTDLVSIIWKGRSKDSPSQQKSPVPPLKYRVLARMKGFRLGLESGSSTVFLECHHIGGAISNDPVLRWHLELADLALSLALRDAALKLGHFSNRENRSAFVIIDARVEMGNRKRDSGQILKIAVNKIHAVMQPSSIGQVGDFIDHLQAEIALRQEKRAQDMAEFKEKTKSLLRSLDIATGNSQPQSLYWFDHYIVDVSLANIGVAFPLTLNQELRLPRSGLQDRAAVRAFLFSIKSITFGSQKGESGQACMKGFSFQFVPQFRQLNDRDYAGENHLSRNRLLYPEMTAQLRVERKSGSRELHVAGEVDGFILDVDSSIPNYISSLIDVYRHGKNHVERLAHAPRTATHSSEESSDNKSPVDANFEGLLTSNIFMSFTFRSGRVQLFNSAHADVSKTRSISTTSRETPDDQHRESNAEVFNLPVVSVWGEYRAAPASSRLNASRDHVKPSTLLFKSTVHSSQNTLRPTLLPFVTALVKNIEDRMRHTSKSEAHGITLASPRIAGAQLQQDDSANRLGESVSSMQISLSLRIDQSKLELTCQPDVNVVAGVNWDSGGFVVNISPGAHRVTFSGSVGGLTVGLKHGFLSEDCMRLHARNLAFNVDFAKARGSTVSSVSVVCDTEFSGGVRFSRLQDILCFKAVWLDRIPIINAPPVTPSGLGSRTTSTLTAASYSAAKQELTTALLLRLRRVHLDIDLGQSITSIQLNLDDAIVRTRVKEGVSELSLSVSEVVASASGNLSGRIAVPNFLFQTTQKERNSSDSSNRLLDLRMTSGPLDIDLESEYQKLILYRAEPLDIRAHDDWSKFTPEPSPDDRCVRLTFTVKGTDVTAIMSVGTVPKLVSYGNKFKANLDAQKEGASRESQAFRLSNAPKPENPLSDVANAMFLSARSRFMEEPGLSYVIGQRLSLKLKTLRLVIFPRSMRDPELAQFIGSNIHARLDRVVESDALPPARDLHLSFTSISISKLAQLNYALAAKEPLTHCLHWLTALTKNASEATIFSLPAMDMRMYTDETMEDGARILPYDFSSKFSDDQGVRGEDIYITLNMALYSWLTILRKTFAREMEQVQASADVRPGSIGSSQPPALRRSKVPEPVQIKMEKDTDGSRNDSALLEPPSPPPRGRHTLQHTISTPARSTTLSPSPLERISVSTQSNAVPNNRPLTISPVDEGISRPPSPGLPATKKTVGLTYRPRERVIERLTLRQLGEATPDVMHPFFMKTAGFNLEDSLPQYVHEYATMPTEEIMKALLKLYSKQLKVDHISKSK